MGKKRRKKLRTVFFFFTFLEMRRLSRLFPKRVFENKVVNTVSYYFQFIGNEIEPDLKTISNAIETLVISAYCIG